MSEEELRQYCKDASNEIIKLGEENTQLKKEKDDFIKTIIELQYEIVDLKHVLKEIREKIKFERKISLSLNQTYSVSVCDRLLGIIDKGIGEDR